MFYFVLGVIFASLVYLSVGYVRRQQIKVKWWGWLLSSLWLGYTLFVAALVYTLNKESAGRAALVSFNIFGFVSVVTAILLVRFIFSRVNGKKKSKNHKKKRR